MKASLIAGSLLLVIPFAASAHYTHAHHATHTTTMKTRASLASATVPAAMSWSSSSTPSPAPAAQAAEVPQSSICFDYGHQALQNHTYDATQVATDLSVLKASGVNCLRLAAYGYGNSGVDYSSNFLPEQLAALIQTWESKNNWHFKLILGGDYGTMSPSSFAAYDTSVLTTATWAQAHGIEQLSLGNEQESRLSGMTMSDWIAHLHSLSDRVHAVYGGKVSYELDSNYAGQYVSGGLGSIDLYGLNVYCCYISNAQQAVKTLGTSHVYISEFNDDRDAHQTDQATWASTLMSDLAQVRTLGVPVYYFTYRDGGDGVEANHWALEFSSGQNHQIATVLGIVQAQ